MRIKIDELKKAAANRPNGYFEDVLSKGIVDGNILTIPDGEYKKLVEKYSPGKPVVEASCCGKQAMPKLTTQLKNVAVSAKRTIGNIVSGAPVLATEELVSKRREICENCEFWNAVKKKCSICGCYTNAKIRLKAEKCPKGKW